MKTRTIIPILLIIALTTTLIPNQVHSIQGSYMYVSLSYGRGWQPWTCVVEQNLKAEDIGWSGAGYFGTAGNYVEHNSRIADLCMSIKSHCAPSCNDMRSCPFEYMTFKGDFPCSLPAMPAPTWGFLTEITIPEDIKLVTTDNHVINDELCADDTFKFTKGTSKGEWWERGGHGDSPPIYWVDDVEKLALDIMDYHNKTNTTKEDVLSNPSGFPDGYIDELTNIPVYTVTVPYGGGGSGLIDLANITGSVVCSIKEKEFEAHGVTENAGHYLATGNDITFNADFVVECMYYYFGSSGGYIRNNNFYTFQLPTIIQAGPDAIPRDAMTHNIQYNSIEDFFRVGTISFNKNIKVVQPVAEPELKIKTIITDNHLNHGETTYLRLLITNNGATAITLKGIGSNVNHEFIYCDKETLEPEEEADCALTLTPDIEADITTTVNFEYYRCGKRIESSIRQASSTITVQPLERCTKSEDCKAGKVCCNRICRTASKGACDDFNGDGTFEWSYY